MLQINAESTVLPPVLFSILERIVDAAKMNRQGVFWNAPSALQSSPSELLNASLGNGTAGILLTLLRFYEQSEDRSIVELLEKGRAWLGFQLENQPFSHGFWFGTTGVAYAAQEIDQVLQLQDTSLLKLLEKKWAESASEPAALSIAHGLAGTLTGLMAIDTTNTLPQSLYRSLLTRLLAAAKPSPNGVYWDFQQTSLHPPLGFFFGNAGVDYALAHLAARFRFVNLPLLQSSLAHASAGFDSNLGNWPDFDVPEQLYCLDPLQVEKSLLGTAVVEFAKRFQPEDSVHFGGGTLGVMLSRAAVFRTFDEPQIRNSCMEDLSRGWIRVKQWASGEFPSHAFGLYTGLSGMVLALKALKANEDICSKLNGFEAVIEKVLNALSRQTIPSDAKAKDLSLFNGLSGSAYGLLQTYSGAAKVNLIDPCGSRIPEQPIPADEMETFPWEPDVLRLTRRLPGFSDKTKVIENIDLNTLRVLHEECSLDGSVSGNRQVALKRELARLERAATLNFNEQFWLETSKTRNFQLKYSQGMDAAILKGRFHLDPSVELDQLSFNPHSETLDSDNTPTLLLTKASSVGVWEAPVSQLQFALLNAFGCPAYGIEAIRDVVMRVQTPGVTQQQLAQFCLNLIRAFLSEGHLVACPASVVARFFTNTRLKKYCSLLFPQES